MAAEKSHILYVDDEHQNLVTFRSNFRKYYQIHVAQSAAEGKQQLAAHPEIALILSDQRMPGMTGVEFFEEIRTEFPDPIRMVVTAFSDIQAIVEAINIGKVYYYIAKPWNAKELKVIIDNGLKAYRLQKENRSLQAEKYALELQAEQQEKENIRSQFETLKNQVNPHFLFNSLNVLSSLVHEDPDLAESFIVKLTKVYRYVLELKEADIVPLFEELAFIQSYFFLHQIRFGNNLNLYVEVSEADKQRYLPPLTLQILVENAIKHNIISRDRPLTIELFMEQDELVVRNSFQPRQDQVASTGLGLANLEARYGFLADKQPRFFVENDHYIARVPLLDLSPGEVAGRKINS